MPIKHNVTNNLVLLVYFRYETRGVTMVENVKNRKKKILSLSIIAGLVIVLMGVTYAWFSTTIRGNTTQVIQSGDLSLTIENENSLTLTKALPMPDSEGIKGTKKYTFTLSNNDRMNLDYIIRLVDDTEAQEKCATDLNSGTPCTIIPSQYLHYQITEEGKDPIVGSLSGNNQIALGEIEGNRKIYYSLRLWLGEDTPNTYKNSFYFGKLEISGTQNGNAPLYVDATGANAPELVEGLIPVVYDGTNWVSADTSEKWYAYSEQRWANAVTTTETNRAKYQTPGTVIPMSDINTMWVWIPRYEYKFSNMATGYAGGTAAQPGAIGINFIAKDATAPSDASNYKVHPAFTLGTDQLAGIWVGKFETGNQTACTATSIVANSACDLTTLGVQVKPNVSSWRGIRVSTAFTVSREMSNTGNTYGLNNTTTDSHMMKNTEWGAVAYLSQSIYGKYANTAYSGVNKEVYINNYWNNNETLTGCSAVGPATASATSCAYTYEKSNTGTGASTTGNIYGVYDMSGGAYEYVMGNMKASGNTQPQSGSSTSSNNNSGFTGINSDGTQVSGRAYPAAKYYDTYNYSTSNNDHSTRYISGDATYEVSQGDGKTNGWYSDYAYFVNTSAPWFIRGGHYSNATNAGVFGFDSSNGSAINGFSFRLILAVTA